MSAPERPGALEWVTFALVCGTAVLAALVEALLVPLYVGGHLVPVTVVLALLTNVILPRLGRRALGRTLAAVLPFLLWLAVVFFFGVVGRPEGDVILPGGGSVEWVTYGLLLGGALAGTLTIVASVPPRVSGGTDPGSPRPAPPVRR